MAKLSCVEVNKIVDVLLSHPENLDELMGYRKVELARQLTKAIEHEQDEIDRGLLTPKYYEIIRRLKDKEAMRPQNAVNEE